MLTERERICLEYLDDMMEASAEMIGRHVLKKQNGLRAGLYSAIGPLHQKGLLLYIRDLDAWRISRAGREALSEVSPHTVA